MTRKQRDAETRRIYNAARQRAYNEMRAAGWRARMGLSATPAKEAK